MSYQCQTRKLKTHSLLLQACVQTIHFCWGNYRDLCCGDHFKDVPKLLKLTALKTSLYITPIFQCLCNIFCVGFQRYPLKFHRQYRAHRLVYWGQETNICISKLNIICWDSGLLPGQCQAIIWTNAGVLMIRTLVTNYREIFIHFHSRKCIWKCHLRNGVYFYLASMSLNN